MSVEDVIKKLEKQPRTPRNYESIQKGALELDLKERVALREALTKSINDEIKQREDDFLAAKELVNGK